VKRAATVPALNLTKEMAIGREAASGSALFLGLKAKRSRRTEANTGVLFE
jgi:hypothetical protein